MSSTAIEIRDERLVYCLSGLPMGWNWRTFVAQVKYSRTKIECNIRKSFSLPKENITSRTL